MKFKTNAKCGGCKTAILDAMNREFPDGQWSLDLDSDDRVLEVHGIPENQDNAWKVLNVLENTGFKGSWLQPPSAY